MIRTDQKTNSQKTSSERKNLPERERGRENLEPLLPGQALQALLAGAGPDRLSPEAVLALSHTVGNSAMLEMVIFLSFRYVVLQPLLCQADSFSFSISWMLKRPVIAQQGKSLPLDRT